MQYDYLISSRHHNLRKFDNIFENDYMNSSEQFHNNHKNISKFLEKEVRILCWIMTCPENHKSKARHVQETWGKRCNKLIFISSEYDEKLGSISFNVSEERMQLWDKTKQAFEYIYNNYKDKYDWVLKADDDT